MQAHLKADTNVSTLGTRRWLREHTRDLHDAAEARWMTPRGFGSKAQYFGFLSALLRTHLHLGLAAALKRNDKDAAWLETARINALCDDLGYAHPDAGPKIKMTEAYAWGVSYVLNGSALGASMLLSHGYIIKTWPSAYLMHGQRFAKSGQLRGFLDRIDRLPAGDKELLRGAVDTFRMVGEDLQTTGSARPMIREPSS